MPRLESQFQAQLKKKLKNMFPGCIVLKNNPDDIQGFPDLTVLYKTHWATLECKINEHAHRQPNQEYYVNKTNQMSFSRFVYPENESKVLDDLSAFFL